MIKKILFYYCFILALFITISGVLSSENIYQLSMQLIFLPVTIYFSYSFFIQFIDKNSSPLKEIKTSKLTAAITIMLFFLLFVLSFSKISKNSTKSTKKIKNIILSPSPKIEKITYVVLKKEYLKDKINVRNSPSTSGKIIGSLEQKKQYQLVSIKNPWYEIYLDEKTKGFVNSQFVTINQ